MRFYHERFKNFVNNLIKLFHGDVKEFLNSLTSTSNCRCGAAKRQINIA